MLLIKPTGIVVRWWVVAVIIYGCFNPLSGNAQEVKKQFQITLYGGVNADDMDNDLFTRFNCFLEPSVAWNFHKYFGTSFGIAVARKYDDSPNRLLLDSDYDHMRWFLFRPSIIVKSPLLLNLDDGYTCLWIQAEPGLTLACPLLNSIKVKAPVISDQVSGPLNTPVTVHNNRMKLLNRNLRWVYWHVRFSVNVAFYRMVLGAGYTLSDFDYYACRRNITLPNGHKYLVPKRRLSHNVFISIGYLL